MADWKINPIKEDAEEVTEIPSWFPLDVAALIYPNARRRGWCTVYRFAFIMKEEVDPVILKQALKDIAPRFPTFFVQVKSGLFWYYLQRTDDLDIVEEEDYYPCRYMQICESTKPAMRVLYYKNRISVETFHSVTDGTGAIVFIKTLVARYLELKGVNIPRTEGIADIDEKPKKHEFEDSFRKNYQKKLKGLSRKEETAYLYKAPKKENYYKVIHGIIPVEDLKAAAKAHSMTITEFLMVAYLYAFYKNAPGKVNKPIKISIPVNLRSRYDSKTLRNFSYFTNVGFNPKGRSDVTFDEIFEMVKGKMEEGLSDEKLHQMLCINARDASNPILKIVPSFLKKPVMQFIFNHAGGENKFTSGMTNLGIIKFPPEMSEHIDRVECLLGSSPTKRLLCAMISYNSMINISFTSDSEKTDVQRDFFRVLSERGVRVRIECND